MNTGEVQKQLGDIRRRLARLDEERDVLLALEHGFEGWLRLHAQPVVVRADAGEWPLDELAEIADAIQGNWHGGSSSLHFV